jgi:hypothetical protein
MDLRRLMKKVFNLEAVLYEIILQGDKVFV